MSSEMNATVGSKVIVKVGCREIEAVVSGSNRIRMPRPKASPRQGIFSVKKSSASLKPEKNASSGRYFRGSRGAGCTKSGSRIRSGRKAGQEVVAPRRGGRSSQDFRPADEHSRNRQGRHRIRALDSNCLPDTGADAVWQHLPRDRDEGKSAHRQGRAEGKVHPRLTGGAQPSNGGLVLCRLRL